MASRSGSRKEYIRRAKLMRQFSQEYDRMIANTVLDAPGPSRIVVPCQPDTTDITPAPPASEADVRMDRETVLGNEDVPMEFPIPHSPVNESTADQTAHCCINHQQINDCLRHWAVKCQLLRSSVNEMLAILKKWTPYKLPKDARTLLNTRTTIGKEIQQVAGGDLWYNGIENVLRNHFKSTTPNVETFSVQFSVDGLPLFKSTKMQAWPILMKVEELVGAPIMMVAMFCGTSKPNNLEPFLRTLVDEANDLQRRGLQFPGKLVKFQVRAFVADSPARAFLKDLPSCVRKSGGVIGTPKDSDVDGEAGLVVIVDPTEAGRTACKDEYNEVS